LLPIIETREPRAVAGTLEELLLVAAFTRAVMIGPGVCAGDDAAVKNQKGNKTARAGHLVLPPLVPTNDAGGKNLPTSASSRIINAGC
jgi:hypothetical protein